MFVDFFYFLRRHGLKVSINEWLDLLRALQTGLAGGSLMGFYGLCRCLVVKHEHDFDLPVRDFWCLMVARFSPPRKLKPPLPETGTTSNVTPCCRHVH